MNLSDGIWILPLRERPEGTVRIMRSVKDCDPLARIVAVVDEDDPYKADIIGLCTGFYIDYIVVPSGTCTSAKINEAAHAFPGERFYGFLANDIEIRTPGTLAALAENCPFMGLSYCDDSIHGQNLATHPCVSGALVETLGWWAYPLAAHNGIDVYLMQAANAGGGCKYLPEYLMYHFHSSEGRVLKDSVTVRMESWAQQDMEASARWHMKGDEKIYLRRVREALEALHV